jgi:hypothetical protein
MLFHGTVVALQGDACLSREAVGAGILDQEGKSKKQYDRPYLDHALL